MRVIFTEPPPSGEERAWGRAWIKAQKTATSRTAERGSIPIAPNERVSRRGLIRSTDRYFIESLDRGRDRPGGRTSRAINGRCLHVALKVGRDYSNWMRGRITKYGFEAGRDFVKETIENTSSSQSPDLAIGHTGGRPTVEYHLTLDMAKEVAMVENNDRGRAVRRYFIACEAMLRQSCVPVGRLLDMIGNLYGRTAASRATVSGAAARRPRPPAPGANAACLRRIAFVCLRRRWWQAAHGCWHVSGEEIGEMAAFRDFTAAEICRYAHRSVEIGSDRCPICT